MTDTENFTTSFLVDKSPADVIAAINDVRGWWSQDITGHNDSVGQAFDYRYHDAHRCRIRVTEIVPRKKVAWHVVENFFSFTQDKSEWTGTDIVFDVAATPEGTKVTLTHVGLVPEYECFAICSDGWTTYINGSLRTLITTGKGNPNVGKAITASEQALSA